MGPDFAFHAFGPPRLLIDATNVTVPPQPAALCAFLVLNRQRRITREEVQAAFWPDVGPTQAQQRLRRTLYLLRRALEPHTGLITTEGSELAIAPDASVWIDYDAFEAALMAAYRTDPPDTELLKQAVALYTDDLLKDIYADWVLLEREYTRQRFLTALRHLLLAGQAAGDWDSVIHYAQLMLEYDPFQEVAHQVLMMAYATAGDRSAAMRQYQHCERLLARELDARPLPETTALYEDIRQGHGVSPVTVPPSAQSAAAPTDLRAVPLVGRERELAEIATEWNTGAHGKSSLVLVTGPAGMGKTRLVQEAVRNIPGPDVTVITGHCHAMEAGTPFQLIADLMRHAAPRVVHDLPTSIRADLAQIVPTLHPEGAVPPYLPDVSVRVQEAVTQVIRLLASEGAGLWLVAEDLHWADPASLACLNRALRRCRDLPLLVLATLRDEEVSFDSPLMDWPANSVHAPAPTTRIQLPPLPPEQIHNLLDQIIAQDAAQIVPLLYHETAGNPLFVVETLRALIEQNVLQGSPDGVWQLRADALPSLAEMPMSDVVLSVIRGRIRRLSRAAQEVLTAAAVLEYDLEERLLAALVDPALALDLALDEVLRASILAESAPGLYQFTHIKVREIIYADTSAPRRRYLHRRAAEQLARRDQTGRLALISRLAYHYAQAHEWAEAVHHGWRAAQTALAAGALAEANRYAEIAQDILDTHAEDLDPDALPAPLPAIRFDLLALRAEFRRQAATGGLYYPRDLLDAITDLLPHVDEARRAQASLQQATHLLGQGNLNDARDAATKGRTLYANLDDHWGEIDATLHQIDIAFGAGDMVTLRAQMADLRRLVSGTDAEALHHRLTYNEMRLAIYEGDWIAVLDQAQTYSAPQQRDPAIAWQALASLGLAYLKLGAIEEAHRVAQQAVAASEDAGMLGLGARVLLAKTVLRRGALEHARAILSGLLVSPDPLVGEGEVVSPALVLVRCCVALGDAEEAKQWARRASQAMTRIRLPILFPLSQVAWALAYLAAERFEDAHKRLRWPLEYLLLLPDAGPQEVFALRAAAAQGMGEADTAQHWLAQAHAAIQAQAAAITGPAYRDSFLANVPLHTCTASLRERDNWQPADLLAALCGQRP